MGSSEIEALAAPADAELAARWTTVAPYREELLAIARRRCPTPQDAEDCVQEAMLRAVAYPRLDPARVGPLLSAITVRLSADLARRRSTELRGQPRLVTVPQQTALPEEALADRDEARWLAEQVERLPERERQVFAHRAAGLSATETASALHLSYKAVESAFTRARGRLRYWAAAGALLLGERLRKARNRPALLTAALIASGCLVAGTLAPHLGGHSGVTRNAAGLGLATRPLASAQGAGAPRAAGLVAARAAALAVAGGRSGGAGRRPSGGGMQGSMPTFNLDTGPVHPPGSNVGFQDLFVHIDTNGDPVSATVNCVQTFQLDPHKLGCPPN